MSTKNANVSKDGGSYRRLTKYGVVLKPPFDKFESKVIHDGNAELALLVLPEIDLPRVRKLMDALVLGPAHNEVRIVATATSVSIDGKHYATHARTTYAASLVSVDGRQVLRTRFNNSISEVPREMLVPVQLLFGLIRKRVINAPAAPKS